MAEFPTVYQVLRSSYEVEPDDGSESSRADGGKLWIRRLYAQTRYNISFRIIKLTPYQVLAVEQFYNSYSTQAIEWTDIYTGQVYDVLMTRPPRVVDMDGAGAIMQIEMEGTRQ